MQNNFFDQVLINQKIAALKYIQKNGNEQLKQNSLSLSFSFHGIPLEIFSSSQELIIQLKQIFPADWYQNFQTPTKLFFYSPVEFPDFFDSIEAFESEQNPDCYLSESFIIQRDFAALKMSDNDFAIICENEISDGLHNFIRWFLPQELQKNEKYLLHSGTVSSSAGAFIFLGHSGTGKSTICEYSQEFDSEKLEIFSDDMNILWQKEDSQLVVLPAAMGGIFPCQKKHLEKPKDVKAIFWPVQSDVNQLKKITKQSMASKLVASFSNLNWDLVVNKEQLILNTYDMTKDVDCFEMKFRHSADFWKLIYQEYSI